jgi:NADPH:quinone reductase-like Zn-dependent oxidoreductase
VKLRYKIALGVAGVFGLALTVLALAVSYTAPCASVTDAPAGENAMRAIVRHCYGPPEVLRLAEVEKPAPGDHDVLVRVRAAGVNPLDWHFMRGSPYLMRLFAGLGAPNEPQLGRDFAGVVEAVGSAVTRFRPGDEVFGGWSGAFAEYLLVPEDRAVVLKPPGLTFAQAASSPIAALTALQALRDHGKLQPGQTVLINGASGGVGTFAVQIARALGAEVSGVCSTRNVELVRSLGAHAVIDYTREDYTSGEQRYDLIVDMVGNHSPLANRRVLKPGGRLVIVGGAKGDWFGPLIAPLKAMLASPFVDEEFISFTALLKGDDLATLAAMMGEKKITPVIDRHFNLADTAAAIAYSETGRARGKIIIDVD